MAVIFSHHKQSLRRPFFISAIMPYVYILLMALGLLLVTMISGAWMRSKTAGDPARV